MLRSSYALTTYIPPFRTLTSYDCNTSDCTGRIPNTNTTDTYLQLFDEIAPLQPVYKAFQGASKLCIGEKKGNIAYLYVVYGDACYWLIGYPDAGRKDHLPKLKIRDSRRRRLNDAAKTNDKYDKYLGEYVVVRFKDGPGITNTLWEIFEDGSDHKSPYAKWYKTGNDDPCAGTSWNIRLCSASNSYLRRKE